MNTIINKVLGSDSGLKKESEASYLREALESPAWKYAILPLFYRIRENIIAEGKKARKDEKSVKMWAALEAADLMIDAPAKRLRIVEARERVQESEDE